MQNLKVSELDFDKIKADIIDYIKSKPAFSDYNFQGSALNTLIDILAYNTHYNAFYANMLHNESFLDTAQKRSSVVSRAKELGYTPRSAQCSTAVIDILLNGVTGSSTNIFLKRGTEFSGSNDNGVFKFITDKDYSAVIENGNYYFRNVTIKEGTIVTNTFSYNETENPKQIFTIPNADIDISTLKVFVKDNDLTYASTEYIIEPSIVGLTSTSNSVFVQESYSEMFQIYFGDGVFGKKLVNGNIVSVSYIVTKNKSLADGCKLFGHTGSINPASSLSVFTVNESLNGSGKESIEDIRNNAIKTYATQHRAVTAFDYGALLKDKFPFIKSVDVWGGENNDPPQYGKVFISINTYNRNTLSNSVKENVIKPYIVKNNVVSITPEIVEPDYYYVGVKSSVKVDKTLTSSSIAATPVIVETAVRNYLEANITDFSKNLFLSKMTSYIDAADLGIISNVTSFFVSKKITPVFGVNQQIYFKFNNDIVRGSVSSTQFNTIVNNKEVKCRIVDAPLEVITKTDRQGIVRTYGSLNLIEAATGVKIATVGTIEYQSNSPVSLSGEFSLLLNVSSTISDDERITFYFKTSDDILAKNNQILLINSDIEDTKIDRKTGIDIKIVEYAE